MKRFLVLLALLLTGCANTNTESAPLEKLTPCAQIQTTGAAADGLMLECLDGSGELAVGAIEGPAVISAWASWCTNCEAQRPNFIKLHEQAAGRLQVIGVDMEEKAKSDGVDHALKKGMSYPQLFDPDGRTIDYFGPGVPITNFIAADGTLVYKKIGGIYSFEEMQQLVEKYLGIKL